MGSQRSLRRRKSPERSAKSVVIAFEKLPERRELYCAGIRPAYIRALSGPYHGMRVIIIVGVAARAAINALPMYAASVVMWRPRVCLFVGASRVIHMKATPAARGSGGNIDGVYLSGGGAR